MTRTTTPAGEHLGWIRDEYTNRGWLTGHSA